jgi:enamine deaminase RidA (YjgF/YER057c/UK114 family)
MTTTRRRISSGSTFEEQIAYSRAIVSGEWVFVSGCTGFDYSTMSLPDDVVGQAEQAMRNVEAALLDSDAAVSDVVRVHYLLPDRSDFEPCWPTLQRWFGGVRPAATMMVCGLLDQRMRIEIEVTAHVPATS